MRLNRKWILVIALVVSMVSAISGTLAYLTSTDTETNTFTVGNVKIDLQEPSYDGDYQTLLPGVVIEKDPQIFNEGRTDAWVWMEITVPTDLVEYIDWNETDWDMSAVPRDTTTVVTMKRTTMLVSGGRTEPAFTKIELPASLTQMPDSIAENQVVDIVVNAYAIQDANFADIGAAIEAYNGENGAAPGTPSGTVVSSSAEMIEALKNGGEVVLTQDITLEDTATVPAGITTTLNLNGHTVSQEKECTESYSMIANAGTLTITGNGTLRLSDSGENEGSAWGSYTIHNTGTLIVENGTIEHIGLHTSNNVNNAIFHYSGTTTINGGTISAPRSRSLREWKGSVTINGGTFDGQVWVQAMEDCSLTINGGSFKPATQGNDGSSVFVTNDSHSPSLSVTGGNFATKIGCTVPSKLGGVITGGTFTEEAKAYTDPLLFAESFGN